MDPLEQLPVIEAERLSLVAMPPEFLEVSLAGDREQAGAILGAAIPPDWFEEQGLLTLWLAALQSDPDLQPWLLRAIVLREQGIMIGHAGFHTRPDPDYLQELAPGGVEYGYTIFAPFRRQGYAREASRALMKWAYEEHGVTRFVVSIRPDNIASRRVAAYFGFERIGSHVDVEDGFEEVYRLDLTRRNSSIVE